MTADEIREKFPFGCRVGPTDTHCYVAQHPYQNDLAVLHAVVVGYSRDNRCIRVLRIGSSSVENFYHEFYEKIADRVEDSVTDWLTNRRVT